MIHKYLKSALGAFTLVVGLTALPAAQPAFGADAAKVQITVLHDAFGKDANLHKDWGYAAFIEY
jgi:hypothetical protein